MSDSSIHTYLFIHTYIQTYIHTYIHTYTHNRPHRRGKKAPRRFRQPLQTYAFSRGLVKCTYLDVFVWKKRIQEKNQLYIVMCLFDEIAQKSAV